MILSNSYKVNMKQSYKKILYLHAALNKTFVFLALQGFNTDVLIHVDLDGNILFIHKFEKPVLTMGMLSNYQVIVLQTRKHSITVINLINHHINQIPYLFIREQIDQNNIITFSQSKLLCLEEKGSYHDNRYKLTYFKYPLTSNQPLEVFQSLQDQWTYQYKTYQVNNHSMMLWLKPRQEFSFQFKTHELVNSKSKCQYYKLDYPLLTEENEKNETLIRSAWQIQKNKFLFVFEVAQNSKRQSKCGNCVVQLANSAPKISQFVKFDSNHCLFSVQHLGRYSVFKYFMIQGGKIVSSAFFVDNQVGAVVGKEKWEPNAKEKCQYQGYMPGLLCQGKYDNENVSQFQVNLKLIVDKQELYTFLLTQSHWSQHEDLTLDMLDLLI